MPLFGQSASSYYFRILTPDSQPDGLTPNLASVEGQAAVNALIEPDTALIVVDIRSTHWGQQRHCQTCKY